MSNYCTNCKLLFRGIVTKRYFCHKSHPRRELTTLCGNPAKLLQCINENWYEDKNKSEVSKIVTEHGRAMQFIVDKMLEQQEKKMTTEEMIKVMQAYVDGKDLQYRNKRTGIDWQDVTKPAWEWYGYEYRIKPTPTYRPLKPEELIELKGKWLKAKNDTTISLITDLVERSGVRINGTYKSLHELFNYWTYEDGTPVGRIIEE